MNGTDTALLVIDVQNARDSFYETPRRDELSRRGVGRLVVAGCRTQYCVDTTCRSAVAHGYDVTLASDAYTTMDEVLSPAQIIAHHNALLDEFGNDRHTITVRKAAELNFN